MNYNMDDKSIYFTRHAKNRIRKFKLDKETVLGCINSPKYIEVIDERINHWCPYLEKYIRVSIVEEDNKLAILQ